MEELNLSDLVIIRSTIKKVLKDEMAGTHYHKCLPGVLSKIELKIKSKENEKQKSIA